MTTTSQPAITAADRIRILALALLDSGSDTRSEATARWVADLDHDALLHWSRHHGLILDGGKLNPRKVQIPAPAPILRVATPGIAGDVVVGPFVVRRTDNEWTGGPVFSIFCGDEPLFGGLPYTKAYEAVIELCNAAHDTAEQLRRLHVHHTHDLSALTMDDRVTVTDKFGQRYTGMVSSYTTAAVLKVRRDLGVAVVHRADIAELAIIDKPKEARR